MLDLEAAIEVENPTARLILLVEINQLLLR